MPLGGEQPSVGARSEAVGSARGEVATCVGAGTLRVVGRTRANGQTLEVAWKKRPRGSGGTWGTPTQLRKVLKVAGLWTSLG